VKTFLVYKSSAGSGKTYTLVKEYLLLALADKHNLGSQYRSILAITFTNKAAAEMKWRIIKALKELSSGQAKDLGNTLCQALNITEADLRFRADVVLSEILHNYSDFSIGTIDSFTHRIIRTFALDLDLPVNFQIETDADYVFGKIVSLLLSDLGKDKDLTDYLVHYSLSQAEDNKNWNPEQSLLEFIHDIYKEGKAGIVQSLQQLSLADFDALKKNISAEISAYEKALEKTGEEALALVASKSLGPDDFYQGNRGILSFFKKLSLGEKLGMEDLYNSIIQKIFEEDKWHGAKASGSAKSSIDAIKGQLLAYAKGALDQVRDGESRYNLLKLINKNITAMGLVNELAKLTNQFKDEENILFISEFNERIANVVNNEPTPFIYERLGDRYQHFLLDEFQDTSILQWQNILPLLDNSLASGRMNLIVGDGKQSIYRWRNANVEQFSRLPEVAGANASLILSERQATLQRTYEGRQLNKNYRSRSEVVTFNNALFDHLAATYLHTDFKTIYDKQAQAHKEDGLGYVSIDFPEPGDRDTDEVNCGLVLHYVNEALKDGYSYKDLCVIVRRNSDGNQVANSLIEQGIPVVSSESLLLNNALEVNVLVSFLRYLGNENDLVSGAVVINYLHHRGVLDEQQYTAHLKDLTYAKLSLFHILQQCGIDLQKGSLQLKNIYDICIDAITALRLEVYNPGYIRFFLDEVLNFLTSNTSNISLFAEWWERRTGAASVVIPEGMNAVTIITIHKSKGLEYPVVIIPYAQWKVTPNARLDRLWVDMDEVDYEEIKLQDRPHYTNSKLRSSMVSVVKELENTVVGEQYREERMRTLIENLNLLYVAFTRPVQRLYVLAKRERRWESGQQINHWLRDYLNQEGFTPAWDETISKYIISEGASSLRHAHVSAGTSSFVLKNILSNDRTESLRLRRMADRIFDVQTFEPRHDRLQKMRYLLTRLKTISGLPEALEKLVSEGIFTRKETHEIENLTVSLLQDPSLQVLYQDENHIQINKELLVPGGKMLHIDRVVQRPGGESIFMSFVGGNSPDEPRRHLKKLIKTFSENGKPSRGVLITLEDELVEWVEP